MDYQPSNTVKLLGDKNVYEPITFRVFKNEFLPKLLGILG